MTLVVFDMDRTLLNAQSQISAYTRDTLRMMRREGIDYTIATGRTLQAALQPLDDHGFDRSMVLKNGAVIWEPSQGSYSHHHLLTPSEVNNVIGIFTQNLLTPFVFTLEQGERHAVYHAPLKEGYETKLAHLFEKERELPLQRIEEMPQDAHVINVSAMGTQEAVNRVVDFVAHHPHLVAYSGIALKEQGLAWLDVHHSEGSKGNGVSHIAKRAGYTEIIAFGDGDNDLSLFEVATEAYAVANADDELKEIATQIIGHHDEDGVAQFLRERFNLS